ncbi:CWF19 protein 1-like [Tropilaelaps mercedesae]|uniref:CWF19 protein 1-like n=1 Tax=Tropilaelaps mercedesae TaxID=418985 RepID=A0A1V9XLU9_9ACAR|nr:CWF19 protein 1-like [Tropilaelaps mercedesae]
MSDKAIKILVCGDVHGKLDQLYKRVAGILAKGQQFDSLFVVGEFFAPFSDALTTWEGYLSGVKKVPLVTYILGPKTENLSKFYEGIDEGGELCPNVIYMGRQGITTLASGLRVAYFSGTDCGSVKTANHTYSLQEIHRFLLPLVKSDTYVDILLTADWPSGVTKYAGANPLASKVTGSVGVAQMAYFLKPRYHFTASNNLFYERVPYRNHKVLTERSTQATRFISLAQVGSKERYLYAFNITPIMYASHAEVTRQADNTTENPYPAFSFAQQEEEAAFKGFFYDSTARYDKGPKKKRQKRGPDTERAPRLQQISQDDCWFCLASPKVAKHLIGSIGELCYLAMAKGGITPYHCMILPVAHHRNMAELDLDTRIELAKYKAALNRFLESKKLYAIYFERNFRCSHMQLQVVPVGERITEDEVRAAFVDYGSSVGVQMEEIPLNTDIAQAVGNKDLPYFFAEFGKTKMLARIKGNFPLNFGREVLCCSDILDQPQRSDWKKCALPEDQETKLTQAFKEEFAPFDWTQEDDSSASD